MTAPRANQPAPAGPPLDLPPELANHPRYRVLRELGRGGMGVVYQARQTVLDRPVVIKVISKFLVDHTDALERFRREARAAARLAHPNIVAAYDADQAGDLHFLVMEFVPGQSLAEVLHKRGPLPVAQACGYVRQAALGLQHAHERGMVHRDIKPQNLMLTPQGQVKILDFGLAKVASEHGSGTGLTASGAYVGTPDYSAPEQATNARTADIRADLYSLGCTLYCLLAGRPPFHEETQVLTILAHLEKEPVPLARLRPDVPAALWAVVARLLAKDPARRYQTPAEVAQALAPFARAERKARRASVPPLPVSREQGTLLPQDTARPPGLPKEEVRPVPGQARTVPPGPPVPKLLAEAERPESRQAAPPKWPGRWWLGGVVTALVGALALGACLLGGLIVWATHTGVSPGESAAQASLPRAPSGPPPAFPAAAPDAVQNTSPKPAPELVPPATGGSPPEQPAPDQRPVPPPGKPPGPGGGKAVARIRIGDREVRASLQGGGVVSAKVNATVIRFAAGTLVIEKGAVRLDGEELAPLPEGTKHVEVDYSAGKLSITADGKPVVSNKEVRPPG
jgi:serine/threonine protein kinase